MSIETLFLFLLIAFVIFSLPTWPYSNSCGYRKNRWTLIGDNIFIQTLMF